MGKGVFKLIHVTKMTIYESAIFIISRRKRKSQYFWDESKKEKKPIF